MTYFLQTILRIVITIGVIIGLGMCFWSSVQGDWKIALIALATYCFSLVMLA